MAIGALPKIHDLTWHDTITPDGKPDHVVPVTQPPLRHALEGRPAPRSGIHSLSRFLNRSDKPQVEVSARTFALLKEYEPVQQRVSKMVGHRANTVTGILASGGAASERMRMANEHSAGAGQYSLERGHGTVQYGAGVCVTVNNVLNRVTAEKASRRALGRRPQPGTPMFRDPASQQMPVYFQHNDAHGYVRIGDLRDPLQARDAIVGDVWDALPIVKTWENFSHASLPAWTKMEVRPGERVPPQNSLASFAASEGRRVGAAEVDAQLQEAGAPPAGDQLIQQVFDRLEGMAASQRGLRHAPSLAVQPTLTYRNADTGEIFTPTIALYDYQQARLAMAHPKFAQFVALTKQTE